MCEDNQVLYLSVLLGGTTGLPTTENDVLGPSFEGLLPT